MPVGKKSKSERQIAFEHAMSKRVLVMRLSAGLSQPEVARELGIPVNQYQHYEATESTAQPGRSPMPHYLIPKFCQITDKPIAFLYGQQDRNGPKGRAVIRPVK